VVLIDDGAIGAMENEHRFRNNRSQEERAHQKSREQSEYDQKIVRKADLDDSSPQTEGSTSPWPATPLSDIRPARSTARECRVTLRIAHVGGPDAPT